VEPDLGIGPHEVPSSTVHRLKAFKSSWQISGKRRSKALGPATGLVLDPA
jgi:hypothetical protein